MNKNIEAVKNTRRYFLDAINNLTTDQLNEIPTGFNNNIAWHLGHLIAAQQGMAYRRAGKEVFVDNKYWVLYKPDTKPESFVDAEEIETMKKLLLSSIDQFETDYNNNLFATYPAWTSRYGVEMASIDDALQFILFHEGLHLGYVLSIKKLVKK